MELLTVLTNRIYNEYFIDYLKNHRTSNDILCLNLWNDVKYSLNHAITLQNDTIITNNSSKMNKYENIHKYFKYLLQSIRNLQKKYLPINNNNPNSNLSTKSMNNRTKNRSEDETTNSRRYSTVSAINTSNNNANSNANTNIEGIIINNNENNEIIGISNTLRLEIVSLINYSFNIRLHDIETLDIEYLISESNKIMKIYQIIERETFQHLQLEYSLFTNNNNTINNNISNNNNNNIIINTIEYYSIICYNIIKNNNKIINNLNLIDFLSYINDNIVCYWCDPLTNNVLYLSYQSYYYEKYEKLLINENINDLYLLTNNKNNNNSKESLNENLNENESIISKYLGIYNEMYSIKEIIEMITLPVLIQLLMTLLTNKSILLVSRYSNVLKSIQSIIPRLVWPFRLHNTHNFINILNSNELIDWITKNPIILQTENNSLNQTQQTNSNIMQSFNRNDMKRSTCMTMTHNIYSNNIELLKSYNNNYQLMIIDIDSSKVSLFHSIYSI